MGEFVKMQHMKEMYLDVDPCMDGRSDFLDCVVYLKKLVCILRICPPIHPAFIAFSEVTRPLSADEDE